MLDGFEPKPKLQRVKVLNSPVSRNETIGDLYNLYLVQNRGTTLKQNFVFYFGNLFDEMCESILATIFFCRNLRLASYVF